MLTTNELDRCRVSLELQFLLLSRRIRLPRTPDETRTIDPAEQLQVRERLGRIDSARQRLAAGKFGICVRCRAPIERERVLALPTTECCLSCQCRMTQALVRNRRGYQAVHAA